MRSTRLALVALALPLGGAVVAQSAALDAAANAMGGKDRLLQVRTVVLQGTGTQLNFGQNLTPSAETHFEVTSLTRSIDFANNRWFLDLSRVPKFTGSMNPQRQRTGLDGTVAYNIGSNDQMTRAGGTAAADRFWELLTHPIGFIKAAAHTPGATVVETADGAMRRVTLTMPNAGTIAMVVDPRSSLPARIERPVYQAMLGDVALITELSDYRDVGGLKVPFRFVQRYGTLFTLSDLRLAASRVDADVGNIAATDSVRNVVVQAGTPAAPNVVVDTVAPGVWRIAGQSHHTIAIEQSTRVVLVEAPQNDARTLAAIAKAREIAPAGKPVDLVINTHHHFDHSGGFRAAVSQGLQVATHQTNKDFYERTVFPGVHRSQPDALAQNPKPLRLMTVGDRHVLRDDLRTIEIHHVTGNQHNGGMLVVYLPAEKILIQADLYAPPAANAPPNAPPPVFPFLPNLIENVTRRNLQVERVVGIHGVPAPWAQVQAAASASRAP